MHRGLLALAVFVLASSCSARGHTGLACGIPSDCSGGLVCRFGRCRIPCTLNASCPPDQRCLLGTSGTGACSLDLDTCHGSAECGAGLQCIDGTCWNQCDTVATCPTDSACIPSSSSGIPRCVPGPPLASDGGSPPILGPVIAVSAGRGSACAITADRIVWCWGEARGLGDGVPIEAHGRCSISGAPCSAWPTRVVSRVAGIVGPLSASGIAVGDRRGLAFSNGEMVLSWGESDARDAEVVLDAHGAPVDQVFQVEAGDGFAFAASADRGWVGWGTNRSGEIAFPPSLLRVPSRALTGASTLAVAGHHSCGLQSFDFSAMGSVSCWGANDRGQSGAPPSPFVEAHAMGFPGVGAAGVAQVAMADLGGCALTTSGVWCWGDRRRVGTSEPLPECDGDCTSTPVRPDLPASVTRLFDGAIGTTLCAQRIDRTFWCWGDNPGHAFGTSLPDTILDPVPVDALRGADDVALGDGFVCALFGGALRCGGRNASGELGRGTSTPFEPLGPVAIPR